MALHRHFKPADDALTIFHGRSFVLCRPGDDKGAWSIARASAKRAKIKTAKISYGGETGFSRKFGPAIPAIRYILAFSITNSRIWSHFN